MFENFSKLFGNVYEFFALLLFEVNGRLCLSKNSLDFFLLLFVILK